MTTETDNAAFLEALEPVLAKYRDSHERRQSLAWIKAIRLAPTLTICEALLRGEKVPASALDPHWRKSYGL